MSQGETGQRATLVALAIIGLLIVAGIAAMVASRPSPVAITINPPVPTATALPTGTPAPILVYVTGAVAQPQQKITLPAGSRVQDALDAAGGVTDNANLDAINLVGKLRDGDQIHVPSLTLEEVATATPMGGVRVRINSATLADLMTLPGIGEATAQAIITYRETNGDFTALEQLDAIAGIGERTLESLRDLVVFD